jgi:hypothetical protein
VSQSKHNNRRKGSRREPPTIDLKATVVDEGRTPGAKPQDTATAGGDGRAPGASPDAAQTSRDIAGDEGRARSDSVQAVDAGSTPPAEGPTGEGSAVLVSTGDPAAAGDGSVATADAVAAPVEVRTPFVTSFDAPRAGDETGSAPVSGGGSAASDAAAAMDDGRLPHAASGSETSEPAALAAGPMPAGGSEGSGPDTLADRIAIANEGPAPAAGKEGPDGASTMSRSDGGSASGRAAIDPTVPVADEDLARSSRGSVPPMSGGVPPAPERRSSGFGALAGAGLLGGLVGAGLVYGLQTWRAGQAPADPRLAQIEQRLNALPRADAAQGLDRRIAALETAQNDLTQRIGAAQSLAERAAARAEEAANRPAPSAPPAPAAAPAPSGQTAPSAPPETPAPAAQPAPSADVPAPVAPPVPVAGPGPELASRLAELESQVRNPAAVTDLANRLGALETGLRERAEASTSADQALERRLAEANQGLERRIAETGQGLERRLAETNQGLERQLAETVQRLEGRIAETGQGLERRLTETGQGLDRRLAEADQRTQALARQLQEWNPEAIRAGLRVVLADRLADALGQGAPFADVLGSLRGFAIAPERVQALEPLAASGAPTVAALRQEFGSVAERIERVSRGEAEGVVDRLLRMTDKVVSVRAVGDPNSNAVPDLVARIESALERGALRDAGAAWDALPEASRRVAQGWGQRLKARIAADEAARGIAADAIAALNASAGR